MRVATSTSPQKVKQHIPSSGDRKLSVQIVDAQGLQTLAPHPIRIRLQLVWPEDLLGETYGNKVTPWTSTSSSCTSSSTVLEQHLQHHGNLLRTGSCTSTSGPSWTTRGCVFPISPDLQRKAADLVLRISLQVNVGSSGDPNKQEESRATVRSYFFHRGEIPDAVRDLASTEMRNLDRLFHQYDSAASVIRKWLDFDDEVKFFLVLQVFNPPQSGGESTQERALPVNNQRTPYIASAKNSASSSSTARSLVFPSGPSASSSSSASSGDEGARNNVASTNGTRTNGENKNTSRNHKRFESTLISTKSTPSALDMLGGSRRRASTTTTFEQGICITQQSCTSATPVLLSTSRATPSTSSSSSSCTEPSTGQQSNPGYGLPSSITQPQSRNNYGDHDHHSLYFMDQNPSFTTTSPRLNIFTINDIPDEEQGGGTKGAISRMFSNFFAALPEIGMPVYSVPTLTIGSSNRPGVEDRHALLLVVSELDAVFRKSAKNFNMHLERLQPLEPYRIKGATAALAIPTTSKLQVVDDESPSKIATQGPSAATNSNTSTSTFTTLIEFLETVLETCSSTRGPSTMPDRDNLSTGGEDLRRLGDRFRRATTDSADAESLSALLESVTLEHSLLDADFNKVFTQLRVLGSEYQSLAGEVKSSRVSTLICTIGTTSSTSGGSSSTTSSAVGTVALRGNTNIAYGDLFRWAEQCREALQNNDRLRFRVARYKERVRTVQELLQDVRRRVLQGPPGLP
ncbi:unnamed protein product [Amoebophrya sp. A25]|nr:unnamed protein product [Amoebophrya sp. A25]|eukprot:GSA25T00022299001.1